MARTVLKTGLLTTLTLLFFSGCTTWKKTTLASMAGGFAVGGALGSAGAPQTDHSDMHGLLWGGLTAALVGATMVYFHDENDLAIDKQKEIDELTIRLSSQGVKIPFSEGDSDFLENSLPDSIQGLIRPGNWKLFKTDRWKKKSKNEFIHQDKILEFNPPKIKGNL